jgi:hypothetical protein
MNQQLVILSEVPRRLSAPLFSGARGTESKDLCV